MDNRVMIELNNWLSIDKISGEGDATITLTASSSIALQDRIQKLTIKGITKNNYVTVQQKRFVVEFYLANKNIESPKEGGVYSNTVTSNLPWVAEVNGSWINMSVLSGDIGTTDFTITINSGIIERDGDVTFKTLNGDILGVISINQLGEIATDDFVSLVYETTTENEEIGLFAPYPKSYFARNNVNTIIIDGVLQTDITEKYIIPTVGEHQIFIDFKNHTLPTCDSYGQTGTFNSNKWLKRITIPSFYTVEVEYKNVLASCEKLEYINANGALIPTYQSYGGDLYPPFKGSYNLKYIYNYRLEKEANYGVIPYGLCADFTQLETFTIYNDEIPYRISDCAFMNCHKLSNDFFLKYVCAEEDGYDIGRKAFMNCYLFEGDNGVAHLERWSVITYEAFMGCSSLREIYVYSFDGPPSSATAFYPKSAFEGVGETLHLLGGEAPNLSNTTFKKVYCYTTLIAKNVTVWFGWPTSEMGNNRYPLVEEIEFLSKDQQDMRRYRDINTDDYGKFQALPNLKKVVFHSNSAPILNYDTLKRTSLNGVLVYPKDADYSQMLSTDEYYLGYYGWTSQTF